MRRRNQFTCTWSDGFAIALYTAQPHSIGPELSWVFDMLREAYLG